MSDEIPVDEIRTFKPFPVHCLPRAAKQFVLAGAQAIDCDPSMIVLPLLSCISAAIGGAVRLRVKNNWIIPAILWTGIVAKSGSAKSPAFDLSANLFHDIATEYRKNYQVELEEYKQAIAQFDKEKKQWELKKETNEPPPEPPPMPKNRRIKTTSWTIEALIQMNQDDPKGVLIACDELAGWVGSFGGYNDKASAEAAQWISMYSGGSVQHDRKVAQSLFVHRTNVNVSGTIQPLRLWDIFTKEHLDSGLLGRVLLAKPPEKARRLTNEDIDQGLLDSVKNRFKVLLELQPLDADEIDWKPHLLYLEPEAYHLFKTFYDPHNALVMEYDGALNAALSKLSEIPLRLSLVLCMFERTGAIQQGWKIDTKQMQNAIEITNWFLNETFRIYESSEDQELSRALEAMQKRRGEKLTIREWQQKVRFFKKRSAEQVDLLFQKLYKAELIGFDIFDTGTKPREVYFLPSTSTDSPK